MVTFFKFTAGVPCSRSRQLPYKTYEKDSSPDSDDEEQEAWGPLGASDLGEAAGWEKGEDSWFEYWGVP